MGGLGFRGVRVLGVYGFRGLGTLGVEGFTGLGFRVVLAMRFSLFRMQVANLWPLASGVLCSFITSIGSIGTCAPEPNLKCLGP